MRKLIFKVINLSKIIELDKYETWIAPRKPSVNVHVPNPSNVLAFSLKQAYTYANTQKSC